MPFEFVFLLFYSIPYLMKMAFGCSCSFLSMLDQLGWCCQLVALALLVVDCCCWLCWGLSAQSHQKFVESRLVMDWNHDCLNVLDYSADSHCHHLMHLMSSSFLESILSSSNCTRKPASRYLAISHLSFQLFSSAPLVLTLRSSYLEERRI